MTESNWPLLTVKDYDGTVIGYHYRDHFLARTEDRRTWSVFETDDWTGAPLRERPLTTDAPTRAQARNFVDALVEAEP